MTPAMGSPGVPDGRSVADRILERVRGQDAVWGTYALELTFDAFLECYRATGDARYRDFVLAVLYRRQERLGDVVPSEQRPFSHLGYNVYRCLGDVRIAEAFVSESRRMRARVDRSPDGLVLHRSGRGGPGVLADFMQDYIARMARTAALTGESSFLEEAVEQARLHRNRLRDPATGLWRQGRGWDQENPEAYAPGAWSRGQGWVLRGLADVLEAMPCSHPDLALVSGYALELLQALLPRQDDNGFWHCLVDRPAADSPPETSGTALVAAALYRALLAGWVEGELYRAAADHAFSAVAGRVDAGGRVTGACAGPGPLHDRLWTRYRGRSVPEDEPHGWFTALYACAARCAYMAGHSAMVVSARG